MSVGYTEEGILFSRLRLRTEILNGTFVILAHVEVFLLKVVSDILFHNFASLRSF